MTKFESFSVEDIRKLRDKRAELFKNMTGEEIRAYYSNGAERARKRIAELRKESTEKAK